MKTQQELLREYVKLVANGSPESAVDETQLDGLSYTHPSRGSQPIIIDKKTLTSVGCVHAGPELKEALDFHGIYAAPLTDAARLLEQRFAKTSLLWGVSGFAQEGYDYAQEGVILRETYKYLTATERKPSLVIDGGVREGNLGLNAVVAAMHGIQTLGYIPLQGLASVSTRSYMVAWGDTYQDREILVGTTPDVLLCIGGADGTRRECETALSNGSVVLMVNLKDYGPSSLAATYQNSEEMRKGLGNEQLLICSSLRELHTSIDLAWAKGQHNTVRTASRARRLTKIKRLLEA